MAGMQNRRAFLWLGVTVGAVMIGAAILGVLGTFFGIGWASRVLGASGISDPHKLSNAIAGTMLAAAASVVLLPGGGILLAVCLSLLLRSPRTGPPPLPRFVEKIENPPDLY